MLSADALASVVVARRGSWTDAMTLQKLLYYVQAWHLAITDEPLFSESFKAWKNGPVVPQVWHARKDKATRRAVTQDIQGVEIDDLASDLIDLVIATYGSMSAEELSALTHVEKPWLEARGDLPADADSRNPISTRTMAQFYRTDRLLGGRTAADLAAGGIHLRSTDSEHVDIDAIFDALDVALADPGENPWGGANLRAAEGRQEGAERAYAGQ